MRLINKLSAVLLFITLALPIYVYPAQDQFLLQGVINADDINVRADSTVNSKIICKVNKGLTVTVVQESYGWYKIRLPKIAPSFIKKNLVILIGEGAARVLKDNINIRLSPNESACILGKVNKNEVVNILGDRLEWYKIEPVDNSFGWINKIFIDKAQNPKESKTIDTVKTEGCIFTGIIKATGVHPAIPASLFITVRPLSTREAAITSISRKEAMPIT